MEIRLTQNGQNVARYIQTEEGLAKKREFEEHLEKVQNSKEWGKTPEGKRIFGNIGAPTSFSKRV